MDNPALKQIDALNRIAAQLIGLRENDTEGLGRALASARSYAADVPGAGDHLDEPSRLMTLMLDRALTDDEWDEELDRITASLGASIMEIEAGVLEAQRLPEEPAADEELPVNVPSADLIPEYVDEASDHLDQAEAALLSLEADPANPDHLNTVFRSFHTVKSTSGFMGFPRIKKVAHLSEGLLDNARRGAITLSGAHMDLALAACDCLRSMLAQVNDGAEPTLLGEQAELENRLAAMAERVEFDERDQERGDDLPMDASSSEAASPAAATGPRTEASTRVGTDRLEELLNLIGELVISHSMIVQDPVLNDFRFEALAQKVARTSKIAHSLQDLAMSLRMVPLRGLFSKMSRLVRDLARRSGKSVELVLQGEETEIDRGMVQELGDPLVHLLRNAVDHGIEPPEIRAKLGKDPRGRVTLRACHAAGRVLIEVSDDGGGLNEAKIRDAAVRRGLIKEGAQPDNEEILQLIFAPSFSTREKVTEISGRGVGLDVVAKTVESLRGTIEVSSEQQVGTTFSMRLPLTTAVMDSMVVGVGGQRFLIPTISVIQNFDARDLKLVDMASSGEIVALGDEVLRVVRLARVLDLPASKPAGRGDGILMIIESERGRCALLVDEILSQQQVIIKPLDAGVGRMRGIFGAAVLGDGRVRLILDVAEVVTMASEPGRVPTPERE